MRFPNRLSGQGVDVAIDYQQILMDMNRPQRRQGSVLKKLLVLLIVLAVLGGGGFALWHYGLIGKAWESASGLIAGGGSGDDAAETASVATGQEPQGNSGMPPPPNSSASPRPQGLDRSGPVDVASASNSMPTVGLRPPGQASGTSAAPAPVRQQPAPAAGAAPVSAAPSPSVRPVASAASPVDRPAPGSNVRSAGPDMAATPVLSDTRSQLKVIDQYLTTDPAEAMRRLNDLMRGRLESDDAAEAGYRVGYAARMLRDEEKAEKSWKETAEKYPATRGGRFSALALADTWYQRYAGTRSQISYWDDIQLMYSLALGADDAPFLPENIKAQVKNNLTRLNDALFFGSAPTKLARYHKVESGELLGSIANKYRVDYESIARINGINPNRIRVGMDLKLIVGEVSIVVRKNEGVDATPTVTWFLDNRWMREYPACVGDGIKTPAGTYQLTSKERDPSWTNPLNGQLLPNEHPDNILGSRWMAMKGMNTQGLGIHGTTVDDSVPGYTSAGCVRLLNKDVEELFSYARIGNKVTVLE